MAMSKWVPTRNLLELRRFGKMLEELGELTAVVARCIIQGLDEVDPGTGKTNRQRLAEEMADVQAQINCTLDAGFGMGDPFHLQRAHRKTEQMAEWEGLFHVEHITPGQALEALDSMDDFARMETGVDAHGPRETLRKFIEQNTTESKHVDAKR